MNATVYIATSLDGFIAREDGDLDWLHAGAAPEGEDYGFRAFMQSVDAIVMDRHTYERVRTSGARPYDKLVVVLSSRPVAIPPEPGAGVERMSGPSRSWRSTGA